MAHIVEASRAMEMAAAEVRAGRPLAVPTETVYGLAADATDGEAVARIYETKGRPSFNPLIVHVSGMEMARHIARFSPLAERLAEAFWPGPLTLVLPKADDCPVAPLVTAGLDTIALRWPRGFTAALVAETGLPLAAPSANTSGRLSPTTAAAVQADLGSRIQLIVDDGPCAVGLESTIVKIDGSAVTLLRPGGVDATDIEAVTGSPLMRPEPGGAVLAPGMLLSHYAPDAALRLDATSVLPGEGLLAFGPTRIAGASEAACTVNLSETGNLREAAANLFSALATLDAAASRIACEPVPAQGLGEAINDRLARAAAPRTAAGLTGDAAANG